MTISQINRLDNLYCLLDEGKTLNIEQQKSFNFLVKKNKADIEDPIFIPEEWGIINKKEAIEV
jgi:hypothetical protein